MEKRHTKVKRWHIMVGLARKVMRMACKSRKVERKNHSVQSPAQLPPSVDLNHKIRLDL